MATSLLVAETGTPAGHNIRVASFLYHRSFVGASGNGACGQGFPLSINPDSHHFFYIAAFVIFIIVLLGFFFFLIQGYYCVAQTSLELLASNESPASAF